ncbi:hypothetical protein COTS27_00184 [Spirochaetota bacterium]|nr:hypothetical protein COTS27_00184 [Spirochaetota bacterium]
MKRIIESRNIESRNIESKSIEGRSIESKSIEGRNIESRSIESRNIESRSIESRNIEGRNIMGRNIMGRIIEGRNIESRSIESRSIESRSIMSRSIEGRNIESRNIESRNIESRNLRLGHLGWCFIIVIGMIASTIASTVHGFKYPVRDIRMTSLFGESRGDHFHAGIDFATRQPVFPITNGEVLFIKDSTTVHDFHSGVGNAVIVEHANNLRSYYYHLEQNSIPPGLTQVDSTTSIGIVGNTGYSLGSHLHMNVEETKENLLINPLTILPLQSDNVDPQIISFFFKINEKLYSIKKKKARFRYLGPIEMYTVVADYLSIADKKKGKRVGVTSLTLRIDGKIFQSYDFRNLIKRAEGLVLTNDISFKDVYGLPYNYKLGTFTPSREQHLFEIIVRDWHNNVNLASYTINFRN